jgi:hypothetical protein
MQTPQESLANLGVKNSTLFQSSACISAEALYRPYTMQQKNYFMSPYLFADSGGGQYDTSQLITSNLLNPLVTGCDINWVVSGTGYMGMKPSLGSVDWTTARGIALKSPVVQGWGYDIAGNPVPNSANQITFSSGIKIPNSYNKLQDNNGVFYPGYLNHSIYWPTGPLDLRWNKFTGTWAGLGMQLCGEISGSPLYQGLSAPMIIYVNDAPSDEWITVWNHFIGPTAIVGTGVRVMACYDPLSNKWKVNSADCPLDN